MLRIIGLLCLALSTSACAVVSSERPLFSAADGAGAPVLRPGLWAIVEANCRFNPRSPAASWPSCVSATLVGPSTLVEVQREAQDTEAAPVHTYLLIAGDPVVAQVQSPPESVAFYYGLRPMASDGAGRITNLRLWFAVCEKPTPAGAEAKGPRKLMAGLTPIKGQPGCLARTKTAVRNSVRLSEAWAFGAEQDPRAPTVVRWIRDGDQ